MKQPEKSQVLVDGPVTEAVVSSEYLYTDSRNQGRANRYFIFFGYIQSCSSATDKTSGGGNAGSESFRPLEEFLHCLPRGHPSLTWLSLPELYGSVTSSEVPFVERAPPESWCPWQPLSSLNRVK